MTEQVPNEATGAVQPEQQPATPQQQIPRARAKADPKQKAKLVEERREKVAQLTLLYYSEREIAKQLGVHRNTISSDVKVIRERWHESTMHAHGAWVAQQLQALGEQERRLQSLLGRAQQKLTPEQVAKLGLSPIAQLELERQGAQAAAYVYDRILKTQERRARLLGLDKPVQVQQQSVVHASVSVDMVGEARATLQSEKALDLVMQLQDEIMQAPEIKTVEGAVVPEPPKLLEAAPPPDDLEV